MPTNCPHCGARLSMAHDAFCSECFGDLDEPPDYPLAELDSDEEPLANWNARILWRRRGLGLGVALGLLCSFLSHPDGPAAFVGILAGSVAIFGSIGWFIGHAIGQRLG